METHAQHPAFLHYGGKPVIFFWGQQNYDVATWAALRRQVDVAHTTLWIAQGVDLTYQEVSDGHHLHNITWNPPTDLAHSADKLHRELDFVAVGLVSMGEGLLIWLPMILGSM